MRQFAAVVFLSIFPALFVSAQSSPPAPLRMPGQTIIVTADRLAGPAGEATDSVTVITAEQLDQSQAVTIAEALRDIAGISVIQSGSAGHVTSAFVRGASPAQLLVLVDGIEINDPFFGGVDMSSLLVSGVDRIEVVRGAQSPLYGSQAMAGVINVVTTPAVSSLSAGIDGTVRVEAGGMSTNRGIVQLGAATDATQWKLGAARIDTAGQFPNDEFRNVQLNGRLGWDLSSRSTLALHAHSGDSHIGIPFNGDQPRNRRESDSTLTLGGIDYSLRASPFVNLEIRTGVTSRSDAFQDPDDAYSQASGHDSTLWRATAQNTVEVGAQTVTFGLEHKSEDVSASSNLAPVLDETIRTTAAYAQGKFERGSLLLTAGARWDDHSTFGGHASPRLSAAYKLGEAWRVRAGAGRAFRAPSAGELAYPYYGNPALEPETSRSLEAGIDFGSARATLALTAFESKYRELISFDPVTFVAANIARATVRGAEVTAGVRLTGAWRIDGAYTHLLTRDEETGLPLYRRPRNTASVTLGYRSGAWGVSTNVNAIGRRFERDFTSWSDRYNDGYVKFDVASSYRFRPTIQVTARVENLFDREYAEALAFPAPGRTLYGGLQFGF